MNFEEKLKSQKVIIAIALILMSLISFNFALKGSRGAGRIFLRASVVVFLLIR